MSVDTKSTITWNSLLSNYTYLVHTTTLKHVSKRQFLLLVWRCIHVRRSCLQFRPQRFLTETVKE